MPSLIIRYPLDLTGRSTNNLVQAEPHNIGATSASRKNRVIVPKYGAFYTEGLRVRVKSTGKVLEPKTQYVCTEFYQDASVVTGLEVCCAIVITDTLVPSDLEIFYQVVGGEFSVSAGALQDAIDNLNIDNRPVHWGDIIGLPETFAPSDHLHDIGDLYGFEYLIPVLENMVTAILTGSGAVEDAIMAHVNNKISQLDGRITTMRGLFDEHANDEDNPHKVTKGQVGLGNVSDYPIASDAEATNGGSNQRYMTPAGVSLRVNAILDQRLEAHLQDKQNPHAVTKAQVGLGNVLNYAIATQGEAEDGTSSTRYMTPQRTAQAVKKQVGDLFTSHANDFGNPHKVTKAQVGLNFVQNYPIATEQEALAGERADRYMTPLLVRYMVNQISGELTGGHVTNYSNPHRVTKAQVGLGSVQDYPIATQQQAESGDINTAYMTPARTKQAIAAQMTDVVGQHSSRKDNPHEVTKAQVGLGSVQNYAIANTQEALEGSLNTRYMTPSLVKAVVGDFKATVFDPFAARTDNPHKVSKAQVGLGSVQDYGVATTAEMQAAGRLEATAVNNKYVTPLGVRTAMATYDNDVVGPHIGNLDNPHQVTKAQVGLGSVLNYAVASEQEAIAGELNTRYMTPLRVKQFVMPLISGGVDGHANRKDNPHEVTAAQVGAYTTSEVDSRLARKLDTSLYSGKRGQVLFTDEDNGDPGASLSRVVSRLGIVLNDSELASMQSDADDPTELVNTYRRVSINAEGEPNGDAADNAAWTYNTTTNRTENSRTSPRVVGLLSNETFEDFDFEVLVDSRSATKGLVGLVIGAVDDGGIIRTITVTRTPGGSLGFAAGLTTQHVPAGNTTAPMALMGIQYDLGQRDSKLIKSTNKLKWGDGVQSDTRRLNGSEIAGNTGWAYQLGGCRIRVTRVGKVFTVRTTDFILDSTGSATIQPDDARLKNYVAAAQLSFSVDDLPELAVFNGPVSIGYMGLNNPSRFLYDSLPGSRPTIIDGRTGAVQQWSGSGWAPSDLSAAELILPGRMYNNQITGRLFAGLGDGSFEEVKIFGSASADMDLLIASLTESFNDAATDLG